MLNVAWAIMLETGLLRDQKNVADLDEARRTVWDAYRAAGVIDQDVQLGIALAFAQAGREHPKATTFESTLVRVAVTPA